MRNYRRLNSYGQVDDDVVLDVDVDVNVVVIVVAVDVDQVVMHRNEGEQARWDQEAQKSRSGRIG